MNFDFLIEIADTTVQFINVSEISHIKIISAEVSRLVC